MMILLTETIDDIKKEIIRFHNEVYELLNEEHSQKITEKYYIDLKDRYQMITEKIIVINTAIENIPEYYQTYKDSVDYYNYIIKPKFSSLNEDIKTYNKKVGKKNWKYYLKTYEAAKMTFKEKCQIHYYNID